MKSTLTIILTIVIIAAIIAIIMNSGAPEDITRSEVQDVQSAQQVEQSEPKVSNIDISDEVEMQFTSKINSFTFTGYGPGKSHTGTFEEINVSDVVITDGIPSGGMITFVANSVKTDSAGLDAHLCRDDFFNCAVNPNITFQLTKVEHLSNNHANVSGELTLNGITKVIMFPVTEESGIYSADFTVNTEPFGINVTGVDKEVRIQFNGTLE